MLARKLLTLRPRHPENGAVWAGKPIINGR